MAEVIEGLGNEVLVALIFSALVYIFVMLNVWRGFNAAYQWGRHFIQTQLGPRDLDADDVLLRAQDLRADAPAEVYSCSICLSPLHLPVETNCGHLFCGGCIQTYQEVGGFQTSQMRCPLCRQLISMFFFCFTEAESVDSRIEVAGRRRDIVTMVRFYNLQYSGEPRSFRSYLADWPTLMRHLWHEFFTYGGLLTAFRIRVIICVVTAFIYLISPLDVIPEGVFGILGLIDDIFVLILLGLYLSIVYRRMVLARNE